ncbi:MAG: hypothetical protein ACOYJ6_09065 [Caulobacterales bacterium]|jgi:hypothetical protein
MTRAAPLLPHFDLLFTLLKRRFALWAPGAKASAAFVRVAARTEREPADAIRATLAQVVMAFQGSTNLRFWYGFRANVRARVNRGVFRRCGRIPGATA